ncbi:hydrogen gas-evolving membrane-bound hydrogenase subunit E [Arthrobacter subterraneus]|uniref:hydrogen gas-evolving membrane-bound hydrogenase subunit E n=1 Tax=Arthrobacter subterraneus TaxID=335973 RepID=UPI00380ABDBE
MLFLPLAVMSLAAVLVVALSHRLGRNVGYVLSVAFLIALGILLVLAPRALAGSIDAEIAWLPSLDVAVRLRMDGLGLLFAVLILGVGALIMAYAARYLADDHDHSRLFFLLTVFATAMLALVLAADLVLLYVAWELTTVCSFLLIGGTGRGRRQATRALVITAAGGLALLMAVVLVSVTLGTTDLATVIDDADALRNSPAAPWIAALVMLAAFTKSAQVPFHFWLPDAMVAITPVSAYLHAATLVKGGIYLLMRFSPVFGESAGWSATLLTVGLVSAVVGAVLALKQHDLKALLAYSTVSQLGWIIALIGLGGVDGLADAALHTFAHALFKATLFMLVGIIDREAGSRDIRELSGLYRVMPVTATLTALAALSMAGVPPFLGFVSKEEAYYAFWEYTNPPGIGAVLSIVAVAAATLTFAYGFRLLWGAFAGPLRQPGLYEPSRSFLAPAAVPAVAGLVLGVGVSTLNPLIDATVVDTLGRAGNADLALWHGFSVPVVLSVITIAGGIALFVQRDRVDRLLDRWSLPVRGRDVYDRAYAGVLSLGSVMASPARTASPAAHLIYPIGVFVVAGAVLAPVAGPVPPVVPGTARAVDVGVIVALVPGIAGLCVVRSRLAAIGLVGVVGLAVAVWFLVVGGVDLVLTQLLVEMLTVVVAVLVLRRLPADFGRTSPRRGIGAALVAVAAGVAAFAATYTLTGRREISPAGEFLLREGPELSGGSNVVNTILVDFRGLDTLGEATVLVVAAVALLGALGVRRPAVPDAETPPPSFTALSSQLERLGNTTPFATAAVMVGPVVAALSLFLLWRGHNDPGGGFIAALVGGAGVALSRLAPSDSRWAHLPARPFLAGGLLVCVGTGFLGLLDGSFLRPLRTSVDLGPFTQSLTTSLLFDVGIYLCVIGLVITGIDRLGTRQAPVGEKGVRP